MTKILQKIWLGIVAAACITNLILAPPDQTQAASAQADSCTDVTFIFARGSGESLGGPSYRAWETENRAAMARLNLQISYNFYELGSAPQYGAQYPAAAVSGSIEAIGNMLGAFVSGGAAFNFGKSVEEGSTELINYIQKVSFACPETKFVLGGYSQGAMLISRVLGQINPDHIIYVATFGDPKLYLPEGEGNHPVACLGKNLSNYRAYVSDCHAYEGVLGSYRPYQPTGYYNKLGTYCNAQDMMCSSGMSITDHTSYTSRGLYQIAAQTIARRIRNHFQPPSGTSSDGADDTESNLSTHDLLLVFDLTYEMHRNIDSYIAEAKSLIQRTRSLGGRVAIYTMWQRTYNWTGERIIIDEACNFSCTPEAIDQYVNGLSGKLAPAATTSYRPVYMTLKQAMQKLEWQVGATKTAVVFASFRPKGIDYDGTTLKDAINLSLAIDPVNIFAVTHNPDALPGMEALAQSTGGKAYLLSSADGMVDDITGRPLAQLALETYAGVVGDEFTFDASVDNTKDSTGLRYDWDLDADGVFELQNTSAVVRKIYSAPVSGYLQVRVTDEFGHASTMSAKLDVKATPEKAATITQLRATHAATQDFQITFETDAARVLVMLDEAPLGLLDPSVRQSFTLTDIMQSTTLTLVPYSTSGVRGEAAQLILDPETLLNLPASDSSAPNTLDSGISKPVEQPTDSSKPTNIPIFSQTAPTNSISHLPLKNRPLFIPAAPDTGYFVER